MTDSAGGLGMSDLKFMGHAAGMTNIEVAQSLEYNAPHAPSATATAVMETAAWRLTGASGHDYDTPPAP